jgi:cell division protein ZapA
LEPVSVTVQIAGKNYPLKVNADERDRVLEAASALNAHIETYKTKYGIVEKSDLLAMVAFDAEFSKLSAEAGNGKSIDSICAEIDVLANKI